MKKFIGWLAAVLALPSVVLSVCVLFLAQSGEFCDLDRIAQRMADGEALRFEQNYQGNTTALLKAKVAASYGAELLVVGTSRTMQFSSQMFPQAAFYNAGGAVSTLGQVLPFLQTLPEDMLPNTLIVGLDQYFFNEDWVSGFGADNSFSPTVSNTDLWGALPQFLHHCGDGKVNFISLITAGKNVYGIPARVRGSGFVSDGSYRYGSQASDNQVDLTFQDSMQRIAQGTNRFQPGQEVYPASIDTLTELLRWCQNHSIRFIGFLPPYAPGVLQAMDATGNYSYMDAIFPNILEIIDNFDGECYDFTRMPNTFDAEYIDGFHAGDQVYCQMILQMLQQGSSLAQYTDANTVGILLQQAENARVLRYN